MPNVIYIGTLFPRVSATAELSPFRYPPSCAARVATDYTISSLLLFSFFFLFLFFYLIPDEHVWMRDAGCGASLFVRRDSSSSINAEICKIKIDGR